MLKLIGAILTAGVMENGLVSAVDKGTPQGDVALDELDRELERRGHRFVRYADDSNVYLRSERAVLQGLDRGLRRRLRPVLWKQWRGGRKRFIELRKRGVGKDLAVKTASSAHGLWHLANSYALTIALPNAYFDSLGLSPFGGSTCGSRPTNLILASADNG